MNMVRNPRRRAGPVRKRPLWLEVNGQRRLERLYARQQLRRQLVRRWSELSGPKGLRGSDRLSDQDRTSAYDAGDGDVSGPSDGSAALPTTGAENRLDPHPDKVGEGQLLEVPDRRPVPVGRKLTLETLSGYDAATWDIVGDSRTSQV
jgi:hypothetical protein